MAKKQGTNKSQAVRDYHKTHPTASNKEVSEALAKQGVAVSPNHVANIKAKTKTRRIRRQEPWCRGVAWASPRSRRHWHF